MSRMPASPSPFLLGFDNDGRGFDRVVRPANDGYPPYNVERIVRSDGRTACLRITLAVAGFTLENLDITIEEGQIVIRGRQPDDGNRQFIHRGIAARQFQRTFLLAEGMQVQAATLTDGLLQIELVRPEPERLVQRIAISVRD